MSGWLWGNSSDSTNSSNSMNNEQQTQANIQPPMGGQQPPLFVLEQLKHAGVPLKAQMTPYLQLDPAIFRESQPQIILPEGYESGRGKFEFYMGYIGCAVGSAFFVGSMRGAFGELNNPLTQNLLINTKSVASSRPGITRLLNAATKYGSGYAQAAGTAVFVYCISELVLKTARSQIFGSSDDLLNSFTGAGIAGALYRAPYGLKSSGLGAAVGLGLMGLWTMVDGDSRRSLVEMTRNMF
uniref:Mitochondrial import inner membrane translocase subunit Tim23 n=1 Tax=Meloidogyne incognita TaxID=6306 RepID=A0A914L923_MELIC